MTVMTTERPTAPVQAAGSLAIRPDQTMWTPEQAAVLRQSGIADDVTSAELAAFLHLCQRTKLDPFSRQIYLIGRWDGRAGRKVYTPQTSIDGYRVIAHRAAAEAGHALGYEDTLWCDSAGKWRDVWLSDEPPAAAKVTVVRNGQRFSAVARYSEYVQTGKENKIVGLWGKMPAGQTAKCCEALALRKAFPHDLAGVYTAEEMAQADNPAPERQLHGQAPRAEDQWQQPAPVQQTPPDVVAAGVADVPPESLTPAGRDYLHEAMAAPDAATVRLIWADARAEGARTEYLAQIAEVGKGKAAAEQRPAAEPDFTSSPPASTPVSGTADTPVTDRATAAAAPEPATLPGAPASEQDRLDALSALYKAAELHGMTPVQAREVLVQQTGRALSDATAEDIVSVTLALAAAESGA